MGAERPRSIGEYIRQQRQLARLSLRELSRLSSVSNAYLSQIERGLHEPSVRVLHAVADVLSLPVEDLVARTGGSSSDSAGRPDVAAAIRADDRLSSAQKEALLSVYRSYLVESGTGGGTPDRNRVRRRKGD